MQKYWGHAALNTSSYSAPIFTVPANQPTVNIHWNNCQNQSEQAGLQPQLQNVPVPPNAYPSQGTDGDMVIYQPSTDTEWEFWKMAEDPTTGTWSACYGGRINHVSQSSGTFPFPFGTSASGLSMLAYLIRIDELKAGQINHAISLEIPEPRAGTWSWPANRTDGLNNDPTAPAEGERFRLDPTLDLTKLNLSPGELIIAKAMQKYGLIVTDTAGVVAVEAEDPRPYMATGAPNPYDAYFPGNDIHLPNIPWDKLQALAWNYGQGS
jgi:hypothetical protein